NIVKENQGIGLRTNGKLLPKVSGNTFDGNGNGMQLVYTDQNTSGEFEVSGNAIINSGGYGVRIEQYAQPTITGNDLDGSGGYAIDNQTSKGINAKNNWWGAAITLEMTTGDNPKNLIKVYDSYDDSNKGFVNYGGWLAGAANSVKYDITTIFKVSTLDGANAYWDASTDSSVKGYWVFHGIESDGTYKGVVDAGESTEASLPGADIDTKVVVRAYTDSNATVPERVEGYQRDLNMAKKGFAVLAPLVGSGTVTLNPNQSWYETGESVELTSAAADDFTFVGWSGASDSTENTISLTVGAGDLSATATFLQIFELTLEPFGPGTIEVTPSQATYLDGDIVSVKAVEGQGGAFLGWESDVSGNENPLTVVVNADKTIRANFTPAYTLTTSQEGEGTLTVDPVKAEYEEGTVVKVTVVPAQGSGFAGWEGSVTGEAMSLDITMNENKTLKAIFKSSWQ
ncbi:uncharacterized protein METZ01_LOCUS245945, partial [marine metagenome]